MRKPDILDEFRGAGRCDFCGRPCLRREAAHVFARGMTGGKRMNIREDLVALGGPWECGCHRRHHDGGRPSRKDLLDVVAKREGTTAAALEEFLWAVKRLDKRCGAADVDELRKRILGRAA